MEEEKVRVTIKWPVPPYEGQFVTRNVMATREQVDRFFPVRIRLDKA